MFRGLAGWGNYVIGDTFSEANEGLEWRDVATSPPSGGPTPSTPCSTSSSPTTCAPCCGPSPTDGDDETWALRAEPGTTTGP